jgi:hypothetical protein
MRIFIWGVLMSLTATPFSAEAATPKTYMLVASRTTVPELEKLSRQPGTTVDVLTVKRESRHLVLADGNGTALVGRDLDAATQTEALSAEVRIPFNEVALVYHSTGRTPDKDVYPSLPSVGKEDNQLSCSELDTEIARAGAIRWYARQYDVLPFTAHESAIQHEKNFLKYVGVTAWIIVGAPHIGGQAGADATDRAMGRGSASSVASRSYASTEAYRWAITAADRRIIGLLELKQKQSCASQPAQSGGEADLEILTHVQESREALATALISDQEQMRRETQLLDRFDPLLPGTVQPPGPPLPRTVLLRLTALINNEVLDSPFSLHAKSNKLSFFVRIRDISDTAGNHSPLASGDRMNPEKPANSEDLKSGWVYLKLAPGQYQLALDWLAEGLTTFKQTSDLKFIVSSDRAATYIGTIGLSCVDTSNFFAAHRSCDSPKVGDESAQAGDVIRRLLTPDATTRTSLATAAGFFH